MGDNGTWLIIAALLGSPAIGIVLAKYFRPNATPIEILNEVQEERNTARAGWDKEREERAKDKLRHDNEMAAERAEKIALRDALHECRAHIMDGKPPPPPLWPPGVRP